MVRIQDAKLTKLREVLDDVVKSKLLTAEEGEELGLLGGSIVELLDRVSKKNKKGSVSRTYPSKLRRFAVTVHYYSLQAYECARVVSACVASPKNNLGLV